MHILVTNDDGVQAPSLLALVQEMRSLGNVSVLAPDKNWSASGHVKTLHRPMRVKEVFLADGSSAFASDGAPSDCVALALMGFIQEKIDLVVSGINPYANVGHDITYSGTVTAAMEAAIFGVPGVAFSFDGAAAARPVDYSQVAKAAGRVTARLIRNGLGMDTLLSVNIPCVPFEEIKGYRITRQGMRVYKDELVKRKDPRGTPYYWIGGEAPTGVIEEGTDIGALSEGYVSITPLQMDLTDYKRLEYYQNLEWEKQG